MFDTIVAPITGTGSAAVGWLRLSGPEAWLITSAVFSPWPAEPEPFRAQYGHWSFGDDGLALPFAAGRSFTGETSVEISYHGSVACRDAAVAACIAAGARLARPGEFTERAFLNGRIDLTQAEGVRETIEALTDAQLRLAHANRDGKLRDQVRDLRDRVFQLLAAVEASVDFSEEIGDFDRPSAKHAVDALLHDIDRLLQTARYGQIVREGYRVAIVGRPNAGKSSLLNRILGTERAIVTDIPGTTRDTIEESIDLDGIRMVLTDTAGLRETADPVEQLGVARSHAAIRSADEVWLVYDAAQGWTELDATLAPTATRILANKADLKIPTHGIAVSAKTGAGVAELLAAVREAAMRDAVPCAVNLRQADLLAEVRAGLHELRHALGTDVPDDLFAVFLRDATNGLGKITGETAEVEMVERIFRDFCIGK